MENDEELMTDTPVDEEIDNLDSNDEGVDGEEYPDGEGTGEGEYSPGQDLKDGYGKDEFAKTLEDPDYYDKKDEELQKAYDDAKAEANEDYKNRGDENKEDSENKPDDENKDENNKPNDSNIVDNSDVAKEKANSGKVDNADVAKEKNDSSKVDNADVAKEKAEPKKKNQLDRLKDKKNVASAKMDQVRNKVDRAKAKAYQVNHPIESTKAKAKVKVEQKVEETKQKIREKFIALFKKHPIPFIIGGVFLVFLFFIFLIIAGFAGGPSGSGTNCLPGNYDYLTVKVKGLSSDEENKTNVDDYALGLTFTYFFKNGHNDDIYITDSNNNYDANATKEALKNAYSAYYISALTNTLSKGFNITNREINPDTSLEYCDPFAGCMNSYYKGKIHREPDYDKEEEAEIKSILERMDDSSIKYSMEAEILNDTYTEVKRFIVVDKKYKNSLVIDSNQLDYTKLLDGTDIISYANSKYSYTDILISLYTDTSIEEVNVEDSDLIVYSNSEPLAESCNSDYSGGSAGNYDFLYVDQGFFWPIGTYVKDCYKKDGVTLCDGAPAFTQITDEYQLYRELTGRAHLAIDISGYNAYQAAIIASKDGVVTQAVCPGAGSCTLNGSPYYYSTGSCYITIDHGNGVSTQYMHMPKGSFEVAPGQTVVRGQKLATVGNTGCSTGAHLHYAVFVNGTAVNPHIYVSPNNPRPV